MPILDELKKKANGKADSANNIAEAIARMDFSGGDGAESLTLWCVEDGVLKRHSHITKVMIETENDFELLSDFPTGTVAFLADYSKFWRKKADGTWVEFFTSPEPRQLRTALYHNDDSGRYELIINEPIDGWRRNDPTFYQLIAEFPPLDNEHPYIFECDPEDKSPDTYWSAYLGDINYVEVGSSIHPQSMANWFNGMSNLVEVSIGEVSGLSEIEGASLTDLSYMFYGCSSLSYADFSGIDTSAVENMDNMFAECNKLTTINVGVGNSWSTESVTSSSGMFFGCTSLVGGNGTTYDSAHVDAEYARIDAQETPGYFTG